MLIFHSYIKLPEGTPKKNTSSSIGMLKFPTEWENNPVMFQSPPTSYQWMVSSWVLLIIQSTWTSLENGLDPYELRDPPRYSIDCIYIYILLYIYIITCYTTYIIYNIYIYIYIYYIRKVIGHLPFYTSLSSINCNACCWSINAKGRSGRCRAPGGWVAPMFIGKKHVFDRRLYVICTIQSYKSW